MGKSWRGLRAGLAVIVAAGGLMAFGAAPASAAVVQDGPVNYIGPGPCPTDATDCTIATGDVDVVQQAPTTGRNEIDCRGSSCVGTQTGSTATARPQNTAACRSATAAAASDQRCQISQTGTDNAITADLAATPSTGGIVNLANVSQASEQRFITSQDGASNSLTVKANINQTANSAVDATTPVSHVQSTLIRSQNTMNATASNVADFQLTRSQTSQATGATPVQLQDSSAGSEPDGAVSGLGAVNLVAKSAGTNAIKIRGNDTKNQAATSLDFGQATQQQGHDTGGWTVDLSGTDTAVANAGNVADVDIGTPGSSEGLVKSWTQTAQGPLGGAIAKNQDQIDGIRIPIIGQSPKKALINAVNKLRTDEGGHELCRAESEGHAQSQSSGKLACDMQAGTKVKTAQATWNAQTWKANVLCEVNTDACPGGTVTTAKKGVNIRILGEDKKAGKIPVVVLSQPDDGNDATVDDATTIDPATICFGEPNPALASERDCTIANGAQQVDDDNDGDVDLKMHFESQQTGIDPEDATACLTGRTNSGDDVEGCGPLPKG